jgi:hypothetical protein
MGETTCATIHSLANGNSSPELLEMVRAYGDAMFVFGQQMSNSGIGDAGKAIQDAGKAIQNITQSTDPNKMTATCDGLVAALKSAGVDIVVNNGPGAGEQAPSPAIAGSAK